jgi:predicted RNA-binding protein with TRAM domain
MTTALSNRTGGRGTKHTVTITDLAFGGEGVARINDFVVFVPYVIPGETAEVEIIEVKKAFSRAKLLQVITPAADRVNPACAHFGACGGCQYQHIAYPTQLALKRKQVADLFQRIGGIAEDIVAPVVPCPQPYGYRNRIMIRSQWNKPEQRLNIGFVRADCGLVEDIFECKIAEPALNQQITHVRKNPPPKGGIKVVLRIPPEDWEVPRDSFFQNNFFLLPGLGGNRARRLDSGWHETSRGLVLRRRVLRHRTGIRGGILRGGGMRSDGHHRRAKECRHQKCPPTANSSPPRWKKRCPRS